MKTFLRWSQWMAWINLTLAAVVPVRAANEADPPWHAPGLSLHVPGQNPSARILSEELRLYYLRPSPPGRGLFLGWGRDGRGAGAAGAGGGIVLEDGAGGGGDEIWMDRIERRLDEAGLGLPSASLRGRPTWFDRGINRVLDPEVIRLGRVCVGFSPYTAWKRRNPLCLLSPVPLIVSW